jgi:DNA-binding transcriptional ArsR family regulator
MDKSPVLDQFKALADPTRLRILALLAREELSVGELTEVLGMTQSRVSGHLGVLREAGLVRDRRQGTSAFYSLITEGGGAETLRAARSLEGAFALGEREESGLDLGTGTGAFLPFLSRYVDRVIAVDGSRGMLARARERAEADGTPPVAFVRGEAERLPFGDGEMDGVVANMILHHLPRPEAALREIARVLAPGGRGVIVDFESHGETWLLEEEGHRWPGFAPAQLASWCVDAGLEVPAFERVPTPRTGRWNRLIVFAARFGRAASSASGAPRRNARRQP